MDIDNKINELRENISTINKLQVGIMRKFDNCDFVERIEIDILHNSEISFYDSIIELLKSELIKLKCICTEETGTGYIIEHIAIYYRKRNSDYSKWNFGCLFYPDGLLGGDKYFIDNLRQMDPKYDDYIILYDELENEI